MSERVSEPRKGPEYFPRDSVIRRVNIEPAIAFGAGRALLLQLAHPAVAAGVDEHSDFKSNPFKRLQGTLEAVYAVVFGSEELARGVGRRIHWIHEFVRGQGYSANEPLNLLWVHATLMETALGCYTDLVGRLSPEDEETYYQEMKRVAEVFGLEHDDQPATLADFRAWFDETVAGMHVTEAGRNLAQFIMDPTLPLGLHVPTRPLLRLQRLFTVATLPPSIREQMGFEYADADAERYERRRRAIRKAFRATPTPLRTAGNKAGGRILLWQASRHVAAWEAKHGTPDQLGVAVRP